jgi:hypothetical protein
LKLVSNSTLPFHSKGENTIRRYSNRLSEVLWRLLCLLKHRSPLLQQQSQDTLPILGQLQSSLAHSTDDVDQQLLHRLLYQMTTQQASLQGGHVFLQPLLLGIVVSAVTPPGPFEAPDLASGRLAALLCTTKFVALHEIYTHPTRYKLLIISQLRIWPNQEITNFVEQYLHSSSSAMTAIGSSLGKVKTFRGVGSPTDQNDVSFASQENGSTDYSTLLVNGELLPKKVA